MINSSIPQTYFSQSSELITILYKHKQKNNGQIDILIGIQNELTFLVQYFRKPADFINWFSN